MLAGLWRRPSRPWRLGLATLTLGALAVGLAGRTLDSYSQLVHISACYSDGCQQLFPLVTNAVALAAVLGGVLIAATCASVVAAIALSATERERQTALWPGFWRRIERLFILTFYVAIAYLGAHWTVDGIALWAQTAYLLTPGAAGDGLGLIPFYQAVVEATTGAITLGLGAWFVWFVAARRGPAVAPAS